MSDDAQGGNDILDGSHGSFTHEYGDAGGNMSGYAKGGNDTLIGGVDGSALFGDAGGNMSDHALGGNDILISSGAQIHDRFWCNVRRCWGTNVGLFKGGNDVLTYTGPDSFDGMYGDAKTMIDNAHGGDDILTNGRTNPAPMVHCMAMPTQCRITPLEAMTR